MIQKRNGHKGGRGKKQKEKLVSKKKSLDKTTVRRKEGNIKIKQERNERKEERKKYISQGKKVAYWRIK